MFKKLLWILLETSNIKPFNRAYILFIKWANVLVVKINLDSSLTFYSNLYMRIYII